MCFYLPSTVDIAHLTLHSLEPSGPLFSALLARLLAITSKVVLRPPSRAIIDPRNLLLTPDDFRDLELQYVITSTSESKPSCRVSVRI